MMPLGIKTGPTPGATSWNKRSKDVEFICGENDSGERSRAIMALLFNFLQLQLFDLNKDGKLQLSEMAKYVSSFFFSLFLPFRSFIYWFVHSYTFI